MEIVKTILPPMSNITWPPRQFMSVLIPLLICLNKKFIDGVAALELYQIGQ